MPEDLGDEEMAEGVDIIARRTFTKGRQPQAMSELSYHQPNQTGFRPGHSTTERIFHSRVIIEKHLQRQHDLFHNFIDVKKACDGV